MRLVNRLYIGLLLTTLAAFAQYPIPGSSGGGGGGGGCVAGTGITCVGSTISVDTAVIESRATAQSGASTYCRSTTGSATMTCALTPTLTAYTTGSCLVLNSNFANVTTATLDVDALGVKSILNRSGAALAAGDIPLNKPIGICYDGTQWIVQGGSGSASVANAFATSVGAVTSLAIDITDLNVADLSQTIVQCWTGASAPFTEVAITSLNPASLTSITANFSSTANVTCRVNATGSAGAAGATGATGAAGPAPVYTTTTYSATPTFTVSASGIQGFFITLTGNVTSSTLSTGSATTGQDIWFNICQDGTGSHTFAPPSNVIGMGTIAATASACSRQIFRWDGTNAIAITSMTCPACSGSIYLPGSSSGGSTIQAPATSGGTNTLPSGAGTLALLTDTVAAATVLETPRAINGQNFDGSAAITITANLPSNPTACLATEYVSDIAADGTLTCSTPSGGGGASFNPETGANCIDEMIGSATSTTLGIGPCSFLGTVSGTGATVAPGVGEQTAPGILTLTAGTTTTGSASYVSKVNALHFGVQANTYWGRVRIPTLSNGTETFTLVSGFADGANLPGDGCFWRYGSAVNAGKWQAVCASSSVETALDSGTTVAANTWYNLRVAVNAAGTSAEFFLNGSTIGTITTNIPTGASRFTALGSYLLKSAGTTSRTADIDYIGWQVVR